MQKKRATRELSRTALTLTEGLFAHTVDMALWLTIYAAECFIDISSRQPPYKESIHAILAADRFVEKINYGVIKNALITAKKRGWIKTVRRNAPPAITEEGKRRLSAVIPKYDEVRIWDGRLHLVTYDIPEKRKTEREMLRIYLRRLGCGKLQNSVWIMPYNPIDVLRTYIEEKQLSGTIIISDLGHDASIGEEDIRALIVRVYELEKLNKRYEEWLTEVDDYGTVDHYFLVLFLSILRDDPQLPFALLPPWWKGNKAYSNVKDYLGKLSIHLRSQVD